jgi:hypothetical protein
MKANANGHRVLLITALALSSSPALGADRPVSDYDQSAPRGLHHKHVVQVVTNTIDKAGAITSNVVTNSYIHLEIGLHHWDGDQLTAISHKPLQI